MIEPATSVDADSVVGGLPGLVYRCTAQPPRRLAYASRNPATLLDAQDTDAAPAVDSLEALVHPQDSAAVRAAIDTAIATRTAYALTYRIACASGQPERWVHDSGTPGFDAEGRATHLDGMMQQTASPQGEAATLRSNAHRLRQLLDHLPAPVCQKDQAGRYTFCNQAFAERLGLPASSILGRVVGDVAPPGPARDCEASDERAFLTGRPQSTQGQVTFADGSVHELIFYKTPIAGLDGKIETVVDMNFDITSRLQAERSAHEALARFESVIENTPLVAIQGMGRDGRIRHWNRTSAELFGVESEQAMGRHFGDVMDCGGDVEAIMVQIEQVWCSGTAHGPDEWQVRRLGDGREFWLVSTLFPVFDDGRVSEVFCMDVDITERKAAEARMLQLNDELEVRVRQRTAELQSANAELESFSYSVSHDLRAPLRGIDGFSQILVEDYGDKLDETGRQHMARIRNAIQRMSALIDDLLTLAQISRGDLRCQTVDLSAVAERWRKHLSALAPARRVEWTLHPDLYAQGDPVLLELVLQNLLENAWKFSLKREPANIEFGRRLADGVSAFFVADNGDGFDPAYAERLFEPFQRLHHVSQFPGTGIGLATVRRIVSRHGGKVWAEAAPGHGATIYFTLS
jgi:PAS domain S-box-containing protein